ncbi:MAG: hypothetical protein V7785_18025 [Bermanella sp.]
MTFNKFDGIEIESEVRSPTATFKYYTYRVSCVDDTTLNYRTISDSGRNELSILISGSLGNIQSGICIRTIEIAKDYLNSNLKRWKNKWGQDTEISVVSVSSSNRKSFFKVLEHTDLILNRLKK